MNKSNSWEMPHSLQLNNCNIPVIITPSTQKRHWDSVLEVGFIMIKVINFRATPNMIHHVKSRRYLSRTM